MKLISIFIFIIFVFFVCNCTQDKENEELIEYEVFNQSFSQVYATTILYSKYLTLPLLKQNKNTRHNNYIYTEEQQKYIKQQLTKYGGDTSYINYDNIRIVSFLDSLMPFGKKKSKQIKLFMINHKPNIVLIKNSNKLFKGKEKHLTIGVSRVLFNNRNNTASYYMLVNNELIPYRKKTLFLLKKNNGSWFICHMSKKE